MCEDIKLKADLKSREKIEKEIKTNFFVEASAGSGKTTMLVKRMVAMIESDDILIENICAITFTKAAANEFYERFHDALSERCKPDYDWGDRAAEKERLTERCEKALQNIDLCFMGTIDSFCKMILSEHPTEAKIPADVNIISDKEISSFLRNQYVKICSGEYGADLAERAKSFGLFFHDPAEAFVEGETILMKNRNAHFNYTRSTNADIDTYFEEDRKALIRAVNCLYEHRDDISQQGNDKARAAWKLIKKTYKVVNRKWSCCYSNLVSAVSNCMTTDLRVIPDAIKVYPYELGSFYVPHGNGKSWYDCIVQEVGGILSRLQNFRYSFCMTFLMDCIPCLEDALQKNGTVTFFDALYYLKNMLKDDAENNGGKLIKYINSRHRYFLIDEFQDTNPMQAEIFFYLASDDPVKEWSNCIPRPGALFIVGDPKQSIYRFRGADVTAFENVKSLFTGNSGEVVSLTRNFRSTLQLCEYFNRCFPDIIQETFINGTKNQSNYPEIPLKGQDERAKEFHGIYTYTSYSGKLLDTHPDESNPEQIEKIINTLVNCKDYQIWDKKEKKMRSILYRDILIITNNKYSLVPVMNHLDEAGIPTRVEGKVPFAKNEALIEIYKIFAAVADHRNTVALYGALTGNLIGLTKEEVFKFRSEGHYLSLTTPIEKDKVKDTSARLVADEIKKLSDLYFAAQRLSPAALFARILDKYKVYTIVESENMEVVYYTLELIRNLEKDGTIVTLKDAEEYLLNLIEDNAEEERCLSLKDNRDAVHIANLHKIKGLEAPVVILSAAVKFKDSDETLRIEHSNTGNEGYLFAIEKTEANFNRYSLIETDRYEEQQGFENDARECERNRLLYVAATRARNSLIICDSVFSSRGKETHQSIWEQLFNERGLPDFFDSVKPGEPNPTEDVVNVDALDLFDEAEKTGVLNHRELEAATYTVKKPSGPSHASNCDDNQDENTVDADGTDAGEADDDTGPVNYEAHAIPTLLGTMTHKLMEMLVSSKNTIDATEAVEQILGELITPESEPHEDALRKALLTVADKMRNGGYPQDNILPQDILSVLIKANALCEVPFCYKKAADGKDVIWNGIMDVVYYADGMWHIVDYKTNFEGKDLDKTYKDQLDAYVEALKVILKENGEGNKDIDAYIYHIDI